MSKAEKVQFGLKNVHYALQTTDESGGIKYGTPKPFPGSVALNLSVATELLEFYADDIAYYSTYVNNGYTGDIETALVHDSFKVDVFGDEEVDGILFENADRDAVHIALLAEFDTDVVAKRICLYDVLCSRPDAAFRTVEKTKTVQTQKMNLTAKPIVLNGKKIVKSSTTATTAKEKFDNFFKAVVLPSATASVAE